jgi:hypothetical protein
MKCDHPAVCLVLAVLATLGLAAPAAAQHQVPFRGSMEAVVTLTSLAPAFPTSVSVQLKGTGNAARLRRFTVSGTGIVDFAANIGFTTYSFTAANGDTLTAAALGSAEPVSDDAVIVTEHATITGGTGRFAGATGKFTMVRYYVRATGTQTGTIEGTISPPGVPHR